MEQSALCDDDDALHLLPPATLSECGLGAHAAPSCQMSCVVQGQRSLQTSHVAVFVVLQVKGCRGKTAVREESGQGTPVIRSQDDCKDDNTGTKQ
ncbi:hypothetical protein BP6252_03252 [Coleophoma cylindrospora]|uniref:Uncharacterized protein n=1 Tax=Coleophoma cylindrospora TaxID=1849047 RepID=A0A3D8S7G7_9HELO|nr:hypothetical protein BP6252_03252 [Coleophoma cylindrospora]